MCELDNITISETIDNEHDEFEVGLDLFDFYGLDALYLNSIRLKMKHVRRPMT